MQPILIREAIAVDAAAISELHSQLGYSLSPADVALRLERYQEGQSRVWVATLDFVVVGFLSFHAIPLFHQPGSLGRITAMAVSFAHHRIGIGKSLLQTAEQCARDLGCLRIEVTSGDHRHMDAHPFYESQGYAPDCRRFLKTLTPNVES